MTIFEPPLWRPPSEGQNLIIQATLGCSFNACTFCSMYKDKPYRARALDEVFADIDAAAADWPDATRVFLADGDALTLPLETLVQILDKLAATFPDLQRVTCYATPINLNKKSVEDLGLLREKRLTLVYMGLESGSGDVLKRIRKGSAKAMESALVRAAQAGIKVSATVILGLGGKTHWREHIEQTAALLNRQPPKFLSTLQLALDPDVKARFFDTFASGGSVGGDNFQWQDDAGILHELELLLQNLNPPKPVIFRSNHASNCLALAGVLPKDGARLIADVRSARTEGCGMRPNHLRSL